MSRMMGPQQAEPAWRARMGRRTLVRHLSVRLLPAVLLLTTLDLGATWLITHQVDLETWQLDEIFWVMVAGQVALMLLFFGLVISGIRSGLRGVYRLSDALRSRSIEDLQALDVDQVPREIAPLVVHTNDLLGRLEASVQAQRRFVGHAAHQLRTPLTGLKLESELLLEQPLNDDIQARVMRIKQSTDRMIRLGQQLLVLARADPGTRPQDAFMRLDLAEEVRNVGMEWVPRAYAQSVALELDAPATPVWIDGDAVLLAELIGNVLDNALRYGARPGLIRLGVGHAPPSLIIEDDGPGMGEQDQKRAFEAFYRAPASTSGGAGLGLAIVREIAQAHGGWCRLESGASGHGLRVVIVFPGPRIGARLTRGAMSNAA